MVINRATSIIVRAINNISYDDKLHNVKRIALISNIEALPNEPLQLCVNLISIDFTKMSQLRTLPFGFPRCCFAIKTLEFPAYNYPNPDNYSNRVTSIPSSFLNQCPALTSIDLSVFQNVTSIGALFMVGCTSLTSITFPNSKSIT